MDSHVKALRRKLGADLIRTVHGVGLRPGGAASDRAGRGRRPLADLLPRPLDPVRSIKLKLGILLLASGGGRAGLPLATVYRWQPPIAISLVTVAIVLLTAQVLAHGMTRPLREMTAAARAMARGDYTRRVRATSRDEVGELAVAFNQMAADLAAADQQRRELIANVSHELRTPITALQAVLENIVDGVAAPDPATLRTALSQTERLGRLVAELLDLSRIDAGAAALDLEDVAVAELLAEAVAEAEVTRPASPGAASRSPSTSGRRGLVVHGRPRPAAPGAGEPAGQRRPARPAGRHGRRRRTWRGGDGWSSRSRDEGPGIAPEERERVFDRFTRGERAAGGGTGLGLAIARWVVDLHGGQIVVADPARLGRPRRPAAGSGSPCPERCRDRRTGARRRCRTRPAPP